MCYPGERWGGILAQAKVKGLWKWCQSFTKWGGERKLAKGLHEWKQHTRNSEVQTPAAASVESKGKKGRRWTDREGSGNASISCCLEMKHGQGGQEWTDGRNRVQFTENIWYHAKEKEAAVWGQRTPSMGGGRFHLRASASELTDLKKSRQKAIRRQEKDTRSHVRGEQETWSRGNHRR